MEIHNKRKLLQFSNIFTPIICFLVLGLFSILYEGDLENFMSGGEPSLIDPIGFAFAIWGPIFFFLFLFLLYQSSSLFINSDEAFNMEFINQVSVFFILSTIMASSWYLFYSLRYIALSTLSMILYLTFIIAAYLRLNINRIERSKKEFVSIVVPWSMYAGWVTAATIVSITTFFEAINFNNPQFLLPDKGWAVLVLIITLAIYAVVLLTRDDYIYASVGIWVLIGIISQRFVATALIFEVVIVCVIGIFILTGLILYKKFKP